MEGLYGRVGFLVYCKDSAAEASFGVCVIERGAIDKFVVSECLSPTGSDMAVFGFRKGNNVWIGLDG